MVDETARPVGRVSEESENAQGRGSDICYKVDRISLSKTIINAGFIEKSTHYMRVLPLEECTYGRIQHQKAGKCTL